MVITALYAGVLALVFFMLSLRVIGARRAAQVAVGVEGHPDLLRRARAHGNFAEYVPFAVVLMGLLESLAAPGLLLHAMGLALLFGRSLHAFGISRLDEQLWMRVTGMAITFTVLLVGAVTCIVLAAPKLRLF